MSTGRDRRRERGLGLPWRVNVPMWGARQRPPPPRRCRTAYPSADQRHWPRRVLYQPFGQARRVVGPLECTPWRLSMCMNSRRSEPGICPWCGGGAASTLLLSMYAREFPPGDPRHSSSGRAAFLEGPTSRGSRIDRGVMRQRVRWSGGHRVRWSGQPSWRRSGRLWALVSGELCRRMRCIRCFTLVRDVALLPSESCSCRCHPGRTDRKSWWTGVPAQSARSAPPGGVHAAHCSHGASTPVTARPGAPAAGAVPFMARSTAPDPMGVSQ